MSIENLSNVIDFHVGLQYCKDTFSLALFITFANSNLYLLAETK